MAGNHLGQEIISDSVPASSVRLWWLGQSGFVFKTGNSKIILVDPYLSDAVERLHGFKRLSLPPITAEEVKANLIIITHEHTDHLDPDALPVIARKNPACRFAAPAGCSEGLDRAGILSGNRVLLETNKQYDFDGVKIYTASANHGDYSPTALSLLMDFDGVRVLCTGDTSLRTQSFKPLHDLHPDVFLPCINGSFGNMNHIDAALMAQQVQPQIAIPCHFWMFAEQAGDPGAFLNACSRFCPRVRALVLKPGEGLTCHKKAI